MGMPKTPQLQISSFFSCAMHLSRSYIPQGLLWLFLPLSRVSIPSLSFFLIFSPKLIFNSKLDTIIQLQNHKCRVILASSLTFIYFTGMLQYDICLFIIINNSIVLLTFFFFSLAWILHSVIITSSFYSISIYAVRMGRYFPLPLCSYSYWIICYWFQVLLVIYLFEF